VDQPVGHLESVAFDAVLPKVANLEVPAADVHEALEDLVHDGLGETAPQADILLSQGSGGGVEIWHGHGCTLLE
jgi:hypothetical protein